MNTRTLGPGGWGAAAAILLLVGLAGQARSDNTAPNQPPVQAAGAAAPAASSEWESIAESFKGSKADTKPSRDVTMQFPASTEIKELKCVGGQRVKKGDILVRARDSDILASIAQQKDLADNTLEIMGAEKQAALAQFKFDRLKNGGTYSPTEYREAEIGAEVARVQADQAKKNKIQQELRLKQAEASYERYYLEAPFDGIVEEVMVEIGEGVTEQTKVLRLVNTEKMWLDPYASTPETIRLKLKEGSAAWVLVDMPDSPRLVQGKVLYVSPVADSVSQTRRVRVEIENPEGWPAGTQARVRFTDPGSDWEKYRAKPSNGTSQSPTADEIRATVAAILADAESRTSLLAGGDSLPGQSFVPGDPAHPSWGWYIVNPDGTRRPFVGNICWRLPQDWDAQKTPVDMPPVRSDEELRAGTLVFGPPPGESGGSPK